MIFDRQGLCLHANYLGRDVNDGKNPGMKGKKIVDVVPEEMKHVVNETLQQVLSGKQCCLDASLIGVEGIPSTCSVVLNPVLNKDGEVEHFIGISTGVQDQKMTEDALSQDYNLHEKTLASIDEAVVIVNTATRSIIKCNAAFERMFGYSKKETEGRTTEFLHVSKDMYNRFARKVLPALEKSGQFRGAFRLKRKNGEIFSSDHTVTEITDSTGRRTAVVSVVRDMSESKKALVGAEKSLAKNALISEIAHEIANSLTNIEVAVFIAGNMPVDAEHIKRELKSVGEEAERISATIKSLSEVCASDESSLQPVDINSEVLKTAMMAQRRLLRNKIALSVRLSKDPLMLLCHIGNIKHLLFGLLKLAEEASHTSSKKEIEIGTGFEGECVKIDVAFFGGSLPEERINGERASTVKSSFISYLNMCREIAMEHRGCLEVTRAEGGSNIVSVRLSNDSDG